MDDFWIAHAPLRKIEDDGAAAEETEAPVEAHEACRADSVGGALELSEAVEDSDADVSRIGPCPDESLDSPTPNRKAFGHHNSDSSLVDRFVQIDLKESGVPEDDYELQRASGSPVQPELFVLSVPEPGSPVGSTRAPKPSPLLRDGAPLLPEMGLGASASGTVTPPGSPRAGRRGGGRGGGSGGAAQPSPSHSSPPASFLNNPANTPAFFRREDDLAHVPTASTQGSGSDGESSSLYDNDEDSIASPTPIPHLPSGFYDSAAEEAEAEGLPAQDDDDADSIATDATDDGTGFFGRIAWALKRTRDDLNVLLGCSGPAGKGCGGALGGGLPSRSFDISFEEIEEIKFLGSGASGCVFLGLYKGEKVAVKKFRDVEATQIETQSLSRLSHPNIVRFMGVCNQPPVHCIVMEFCPKNLYEVIKHTRIPPTQICEWARQIAAGMEYLHDQNQIHRDLKSPNVLLAQDRRTLRISDFGTARRVGSRSLSEKTMCGSPPWMAPELIRNEPYGKTVDVWSYGVVLWELLTGEVPYRGVEQGAVIFGVAMKSLHLPVPTTAPLGFSLLLKQCWNTEPKHRPAFRQILLHLDILLEDSGFAEVPVEAYFATQLKWKQEMKQAFEKMKQEEMEKRKTDQELLQRREEELAHAQDIRQLYESRLETVSQLLAELREKERALESGRHDKHKRRQRSKALVGAGARGYSKAARRRSKDAVRRRSSDAGSPPRKTPSKKFSVGSSLGSPGLSPLGLTAVTVRGHPHPHSRVPSTASESTPTLHSAPIFPPPARQVGRKSSTPKTTRLSAVAAAPSASAGGSEGVASSTLPVEEEEEDPNVKRDGATAAESESDEAEDPAPGLVEPSEGWFSPAEAAQPQSPKKKWVPIAYQASSV